MELTEPRINFLFRIEAPGVSTLVREQVIRLDGMAAADDSSGDNVLTADERDRRDMADRVGEYIKREILRRLTGQQIEAIENALCGRNSEWST